MADWLSYSLSDFLLFSPRAYYRLFELTNEALWPGPLLAYALGVLLLVFMLRQKRFDDRAIAAILSLAWLSTGWFFLWQRYAAINWTIFYIAPLFWVQGLALLLIAVSKSGLNLRPVRAGSTVLIYGLLTLVLMLSPLIAPFFGRPFSAAEIFGIAPDPTALATVFVGLLMADRTKWLLIIIPVFWCTASTLTLWTMHAQT